MENLLKPARVGTLPDSGKGVPSGRNHRPEDRNINIMLDLETACSGFKTRSPAIIEIAAVQFCLHTGHIYNEFQEHVNLKSCIDLGLVADKDRNSMTPQERKADDINENTILWLQKNIPSTYLKSQSLETSLPLPDALQKFTDWINGLASPGKPVAIWGKPSIFDNVWISNAYNTCKLKPPWMWYNNMCCNSAITTYFLKTGVWLPAQTEFKGTKHHALDDCKHQVKMLVKAVDLKGTTKPVSLAKYSVLAPDMDQPSPQVLKKREEERLSSSSVEVLNTLIDSFYASNGQTPKRSALPLSEASELKSISIIQELENQLQAIASLMGQPPEPADEISHLTENKRRKVAAEEGHRNHPGFDSGENVVLDDTVEGIDNGTTTTPNSPSEGRIGASSDYGDDDDLDDVFHSFCE